MKMSKTTIQLSEATKEKLRDARLEHETNYGQTIERLLGGGQTPYVTESEAKELAREVVTQRVVPEALE